MMHEKTKRRGINWTYWIALPLCSIGLGASPILLVLVQFALHGFQGNALSEDGYGAALWVLIISVPIGLAMLVLGTIIGLAIEITAALKRRRLR